MKRIKVDSKTFTQEFLITSSGFAKANELRAITIKKDGVESQKLFDDTKPIYRSPLKLLQLGGKNSLTIDETATINLLTPIDLEYGKYYIPTDYVYITPYVRDNFIRYSIVIPAVQPIKQPDFSAIQDEKQAIKSGEEFMENLEQDFKDKK